MPDVLRKIGIFDGSLGFSAEVSNLPSKILIFRGTFESSAKLFDFLPKIRKSCGSLQESLAIQKYLSRFVRSLLITACEAARYESLGAVNKPGPKTFFPQSVPG
jgi:hypothetical protein